MTISYESAFAAGAIITGKWHGRNYRILRILGEGANGKVFLASAGAGKNLCAVKIGYDPLDLQSEINVLKSLSRSDRRNDFFLDADDFAYKGQTYPFYVMKFIQGIRFDEFLQTYGQDWLYITAYRLLSKLNRLHRQGWIFGDLKNENVLVAGYGHIELIDYGGVTQTGRSIKQFTEFYDRGFWNAGLRTAEEGYDLFSFALLILQLADDRKQLERLRAQLPQNRSAEDLLEVARSSPACAPVFPFLAKALQGRYVSSDEALEEWRELTLKAGAKCALRPRMPWLKGFFIASLILFISTLVFLLQQG
ncbi:protein kinase domain-containing protein [Ferviditalea candida]|uniref:Serine/threonine protein kinase n=1 Tax=Ferviditalea candida TaxID=3108399 RepID=A0ABU5ZL79_9BACL|nr:serine/threonine protein kinase [Paenibacillaceae bacterium T2]